MLAIILGANALLITVLLFRGANEAPDQTTVQVQVPPAGTDTDRPTIRPLADETPRELDVAPPIEPAPGPEIAAPETPTASSTATPTGAIADMPTSDMTSAGADAPPSMQQLTLAGILTTPPMRLDIHVYSDKPDQRFVFVNMRKYREGDQLQEGPVLNEITPTGVVLSHEGNRFTLERE